MLTPRPQHREAEAGSQLERLRQNALDHVAVDVGQPVAAALKDRTVKGTFASDASVR